MSMVDEGIAPVAVAVGMGIDMDISIVSWFVLSGFCRSPLMAFVRSVNALLSWQLCSWFEVFVREKGSGSQVYHQKVAIGQSF